MGKSKKSEEEKLEISGDVVTVSWSNHTREFSKEVHGEDFIKLAKQFASQYESTLS